MITAFNLSTGNQMTFQNVTPEFAVAYAYYSQPEFHGGNMTSWLLTHVHNGTNDVWMNKIKRGRKTVSMGDWTALLGES